MDEADAAAAVVLAMCRRGEATQAADWASERLDRICRDGRSSSRPLARVFIAAAEAHAADGRGVTGARLAQSALDVGSTIGDDEVTFCALGLLALCRALGGEYTSASLDVASARELQRRHGWTAAPMVYPLILADILIRSSRLDSAGLRECASELRSHSALGDEWSVTAAAAESMALLADGDHVAAMPLVWSVASGTDAGGVLTMVRGFALGILADVLLTRGDAKRVLTLLAGRHSPGSHTLCFDMQRASAHLQLGQPRRALLATDGCIALGIDHCARTVPPVLLRRAIAYDRLGHPHLADDRFVEAVGMLAHSGSATPLLTLGDADISHLMARNAHVPVVAEMSRTMREHLQRVPAVDATRARLPRLTNREIRLAGLLRTEATVAGIAEMVQLSPNTIKTQLRSLYTKLQASSRGEAIARLEGAGFFE